MNTDRRGWINGWWASAGLGTLLAVTGCEGQPPGAPNAPMTQPARTQPATTEPVSPPAIVEPNEPPWPAYITDVAPIEAAAKPEVTVVTAKGRRLVIDTQNVQRLRIVRDELPIETSGSIVLRLDGQGIEWLADSGVEWFKRSRNGNWDAADAPTTQSTEAPQP